MKTIRLNFIGLFTLCAMVFCSSLFAGATADSRVLIVATDYPPYEFEHPDGDLRGFDVEVTEMAFHRSGVAATFEFYPWPRALEMVKKGEATAALTCAKNPGREKTMIFSKPISYMTDVLMVHKNYQGPALSKIRELGKLKLFAGAARGTYTEKRLKEYAIPYDVSPTEEIVVQKLADKRVDVMPGALENILYYSKKRGVTDQLKWFVMEDVKTNEFHLAFSKKWPGVEAIVSEFNRKLEEMKQDGAYDVIHRKYR